MKLSPSRYASLLLGCALLAFSACGSSRSSAGAQITPSATRNGCPTQHIPVDGPPRADVSLTQGGNALDPTPVTLTVGQVLRIALPASIRWGSNSGNTSAVLSAIEPAGYYFSSDQKCVWYFTATAAGSAQLAFTGGPLCDPNSPCPAYAAVAEFQVTVR